MPIDDADDEDSPSESCGIQLREDLLDYADTIEFVTIICCLDIEGISGVHTVNNGNR